MCLKDYKIVWSAVLNYSTIHNIFGSNLVLYVTGAPYVSVKNAHAVSFKYKYIYTQLTGMLDSNR